MFKLQQKNLAYGRLLLSWCVRIVPPIQRIQKNNQMRSTAVNIVKNSQKHKKSKKKKNVNNGLKTVKTV